ncbi:hypothetical protein Celal_1062 [Cellulophaga algicola DSM 14237]|uniref:Uncharacterized protein n=1 Tax=Cellulophaga algicola (strain DSM 14237 / IC166 / ACAM 630) TaxID=688270 RepID=E6X5M1_CELAD|nr:hypothetical protein [Cellulophaga algicola]ADV48387.1 hypothetical protein Celal_1062 [Cellulophaga algicola DSM 14237]
MRKLFLICSLFVGLSSFTPKSVETSNNYEISVSDASNEYFLYSCTATVYYEGRAVTSFTAYGSTASGACSVAGSRARSFISALN